MSAIRVLIFLSFLLFADAVAAEAVRRIPCEKFLDGYLSNLSAAEFDAALRPVSKGKLMPVKESNNKTTTYRDDQNIIKIKREMVGKQLLIQGIHIFSCPIRFERGKCRLVDDDLSQYRHYVKVNYHQGQCFVDKVMRGDGPRLEYFYKMCPELKAVAGKHGDIWSLNEEYSVPSERHNFRNMLKRAEDFQKKYKLTSSQLGMSGNPRSGLNRLHENCEKFERFDQPSAAELIRKTRSRGMK